jgi:hypothetical protein
VKTTRSYYRRKLGFRYSASRTIDELGALAPVAGQEEPADSERLFWFGAAGWAARISSALAGRG